MMLDAKRNRIIRLNLHLAFASVATMTAVAPAGTPQLLSSGLHAFLQGLLPIRTACVMYRAGEMYLRTQAVYSLAGGVYLPRMYDGHA
jgi:hypothetical protein